MNAPIDPSASTQDRLMEALRGLDYPHPRVRFLLGTDEHIHLEARVAFSPAQVARLAKDLDSLGLDAELFVVAGAGARTRPEFRDEDYRAASARVVTVEEAVAMEAFDVVHALKEPTHYEAELQGPFLRLGAAHLASKPPGVCEMLGRKNFGAILDGATVGSCSYLLQDGDRTPIVGSMSRFAGSVAGRKVVAGLDRNGVGAGKVVVVGGGIAGQSAIREVHSKTSRLIVIEPWEPNQRRLEALLPALGFDAFEIHSALADEHLEDAVGLVFAHRSGAKAAEKVCHYDQIRRMRSGAAISDIAIDQGGSIAHDGYDEHDDATEALRKYADLLGGDYAYYAEVNMPREEPHAASVEHGESSLPYVTALLALCAHLGGAQATVDRLLAQEIRTYGLDEDVSHLTFLDAVMQDLRNGIQLAVQGGNLQITDPDLSHHPALVQWIGGCAGT